MSKHHVKGVTFFTLSLVHKCSNTMIQAHLNSINSRHADECAFSCQIITTEAKIRYNSCSK